MHIIRDDFFTPQVVSSPRQNSHCKFCVLSYMQSPKAQWANYTGHKQELHSESLTIDEMKLL